jgi:hypothetical protein
MVYRPGAIAFGTIQERTFFIMVGFATIDVVTVAVTPRRGFEPDITLRAGRS